jgi:hypothetical protein
VAIDASKLRHGRVRGRYFRENFAQAGIDLTQIIPELLTNADAAIAAAGRERGRIQLRIGSADPGFLKAWKAGLRSLRVPALRSWRYELVCTDDGEGVDADIVDQRLGALGVVPEHEGQRGLFGRGLRDVWLAQGGGRIQGVRVERAVVFARGLNSNRNMRKPSQRGSANIALRSAAAIHQRVASDSWATEKIPRRLNDRMASCTQDPDSRERATL